MTAPWPPGVPLGHYITHHPGANVVLNCNACMARTEIPMATVVERLRARGIEPLAFGVKAIANLVNRPCSCGAMRWETRPDFPYVTPGDRDRQANID